MRCQRREIDYVVVLADIFEEPLPLLFFLFPLGDVIIRCLILQPPQKGLVFKRNFDELAPSQIPVQALFVVGHR